MYLISLYFLFLFIALAIWDIIFLYKPVLSNDCGV